MDLLFRLVTTPSLALLDHLPVAAAGDHELSALTMIHSRADCGRTAGPARTIGLIARPAGVGGLSRRTQVPRQGICQLRPRSVERRTRARPDHTLSRIGV